MKYDFNGKTINISDAEIANFQKNLGISKEEAIQLWLDDNDYTVNEEQQKLCEKSKEMGRHYEKSTKPRKKTVKERKVDEEKKHLLGCIKVLVEGLGAVVTNIKTETEISFNYGDNEYVIKLIKHRKPKD